MIKIFVAAVGALALASAAAAQTPPAPHPLKDVPWLRKPTGSDMASAYPERARNQGISGRITLECQADAQGYLAACTVLDELPTGYGFGAAALTLSRSFRLDPKGAGSQVLEGGVVSFPITLVADGKPPPVSNAFVGQPAALVTLAKGAGGAPCPTADHANDRCVYHMFYWDQRPNMVEVAPLVRAAVGDRETTVMICRDVQDGRLANCETNPGTSPGQDAAMRGLVAMLKPPLQAVDRTPMADGDTLIEFNWPALRRTVEASVLTKPR